MNLDVFNNENLFDAVNQFFQGLGVRLNSNTKMSLSAKELLAEKYRESFDEPHFPKIKELYFSGIVDESIFENKLFKNNGYTIDDAQSIITKTETYEGLMIFALQLDRRPTRTQIADLSRAFNRKLNTVPVALLLQYDHFISFALPERFLYKQSWRKGEKVGKVIILRNIDTLKTHAGHLRILQDLKNHNAKNYSELHEAWLKVFDVTILNKDFYKKLVDWYAKCFADIQINLSSASRILNKKVEEELKPQAVIRVIVRLMFIWFMKEKSLIKEEFFKRDFAKQFLKKSDTYYNAVLQNLFFAVLNKKIDERRFRKRDSQHYYDPQKNDYGISDVFRYRDFFQTDKADEFLKLTNTIPYVNGGLFICHDFKFSGQDSQTNKKNTADNYIIDGFSDNKNDRAKISDNIIFELINLFSSYVWTIEESTPLEQDIALDPELLGTVFENLIGFYNPETKENARKQTGSFYTPREIVDYMCHESLKETLKTKFPDLHSQIDDLIDNNEDNLNFPNKNSIVAAITELKILDPACGSGAFPMGMFMLMVRTIEKLQEHKTTYKNKLDIITNCIYGVDIQNIAIEISKLRFFISLLVDYKTPEHIKEFEMLPNLETKFVVADTLRGVEEKKQGDIFGINKSFKELTKIFLPFTTAKTPKEKEQIKNNFNKKKQEIVNNPDLHFGAETKEKILKWNPFNVCYTSPFFDSSVMFGITDGFDIVIGNPPYYVITNNNPYKLQFEKIYAELKSGRMNIYQLFFGRAARLTNNTGSVVFIHPKTLLADAYLSATRQFLLKNFKAFTILNIVSRTDTFGAVLQSVIVSIWNKLSPSNICRIGEVSSKKDIEQVKYLYLPSSDIVQVSGEFLISNNTIVYDIEKKCRNVSRIPIQFKTGNNEWNKYTDYLSGNKTKNSTRLIFGENIQRFYFAQSDRRANISFLNDKVKVPIVTLRSIFVQRTTAIEQPYRIIATIIDPREFDTQIASENSVNVFNCQDESFAFYILGILNSRLMDFYFRIFNSNTHVSSRELNSLPIIKVTTKQQQPLINLVSRIILLKQSDNQSDTSQLEAELNAIVFHLYGLTESEMMSVLLSLPMVNETERRRIQAFYKDHEKDYKK
jgi:hypothetical protein